MDLDRAQDLFLRVHRLGGGTPEGYTTALSMVFASRNLEDALLDLKGPRTPSQCHHDYSHAPRFLQSQAYEPQSVKEGHQEMREEHGTGYFKAMEYMEESEFSPDPTKQEDGSENNMGSSVNNTSVYEDEDIVLAGDLKVFRSKPIYCGRYSTVYLGVWNKKQVAVKVIQTVISLHKTRRKFRRESQIWARLQHPNILRFLGVKEEAGFGVCGALISTWCPHGSSSYIQQLSDMPVERMRLVLEVANGVKYLHSREPIIVHGDLKPANILIDEDGSAKICDFGLIRLIKEEVNTGMTTTTLHTGTTRYLSRELVTAKKPMPTMASDCHAFGCIALEFAYLQRPYAEHNDSNDENNDWKIRHDIDKNVPPALRFADATHKGHESLWDLLEACWNLTPTKRPTFATIHKYLSDHGSHIVEALENYSPPPLRMAEDPSA